MVKTQNSKIQRRRGNKFDQQTYKHTYIENKIKNENKNNGNHEIELL